MKVHLEKFTYLALKLENRNLIPSLLEKDAYILCYLKGEGIPFIKSFGVRIQCFSNVSF